MAYCIGNGQFDHKLIFVLGTSRAGKSLFSRLLSSARNIDWIFEPAIVFISIWFAEYGMMDIDCAKDLLKSACKEIINDSVLGRNANFRAGDMSSIYNHKSAEDMLHRLTNLHSREDVDGFIQANDMHFILDIPDLLPHVAFIKDVFPNAKIIHVVRNGYDVVSEVYNKKWYSMESVQSRAHNYTMYYERANNSGETVFFPWWCPEERAGAYLAASDEARSAMYWIYGLGALPSEESLVDLTVRYEDFVRRPAEALSAVEKIIPCKWTSKRSAIESELEPRISIHGDERFLSGLSDEDKTAFHALQRRYGYE